MNNYRSIGIVLISAVVLSACSLPSWMGGAKEDKPKLAGERIAVLPESSQLQPDAAVKEKAFELPEALSNDAWPAHGGGFKSLNSNLLVSGKLEELTHATAGGGEAFLDVLIPTPVVGASLVFAMDQAGDVSAHAINDIRDVKWKYHGLVEEDAVLMAGGGLAYADGKLYAISGRGMVAAVDATSGKELWRKALRVPFRGAPKVEEGKLFAITLDNQTYALNSADGSVAWTHRGISEVTGLMNAVSPTVESNLVVVPYSSGEVYALSVADGKEVWNETLTARKQAKPSATFSGIGGDPLVDGGVVFAVSSGGVLNVQALISGKHVWDKPIGSVNTPWLTGDGLFVLTTDNALVGMVKFTGKIRWVAQLQSYADPVKKKDPITWRGPVMLGGKLAVVGSNGQLVLVSAQDGHVVSTLSIPENIYTPPVVAAGKMFLIGQDATLYSLK